MDEKPKSIWKKQFTGRSALKVWMLVVGLATGLACFLAALASIETPLGESFAKAALVIGGIMVVCALVIYIIWPLSRWLFWKHWRRTAFASFCFATLVALFYAEENWRSKRAWENYKREWEAKGEKFNLSDFVPPSVPDEQNFACTPIWVESIKATLGPKRAYRWYGDKFPNNGRTNFTERLLLETWHQHENLEEPKLGDWKKAERTDLKAWQAGYRATNRLTDASFITNDFPIARQPQSPAQDVLLALSKHDAAIEELRQASQLAYARFPLEYDAEDPFSILLPHLAALKRGSQILQLRAVAELANGQSEQALYDVKLALRLTDSVRTEPILISHLVRIAMLELTVQPVWEGLAAHRWSEAQLVALDTELAKLDFLSDYEFSKRSELAFMPKVLEYRRQTRDTDFFFKDDYGDRKSYPLNIEFAMFVFRYCPGGWFYQNQIRYCQFGLQHDLPTIDAVRQLAFPASAKQAAAARLKEVAPLSPYNFIEHRLLFPPYDFLAPDHLAEKFANGQNSVNLARVAVALERYRLAHGEFPETLVALAPRFLEIIPHDVIGGQPLKYRRTSDGQFVLYSIGWNEKDDGGVVVFKKGASPEVDINHGDWVWRYPQK